MSSSVFPTVQIVSFTRIFLNVAEMKKKRSRERSKLKTMQRKHCLPRCNFEFYRCSEIFYEVEC